MVFGSLQQVESKSKNVSPAESPNLFASGKVAMFVGGEWSVSRFKAGVDLQLRRFLTLAGGNRHWHRELARRHRQSFQPQSGSSKISEISEPRKSRVRKSGSNPRDSYLRRRYF